MIPTAETRGHTFFDSTASWTRSAWCWCSSIGGEQRQQAIDERMWLEPGLCLLGACRWVERLHLAQKRRPVVRNTVLDRPLHSAAAHDPSVAHLIDTRRIQHLDDLQP